MRGRFAPSPSGEMHLGNAWTALLAWLQVRRAGGTMALRMEDLDPERSKPEYAEALMEDLAWLGLDWDEGPDSGGPYSPYRQDDRRSLYAQAVKRLEQMGLLYPCYCTRAEIRSASLAPNGPEEGSAYPGACRSLSVEERRQNESQGRRPALRVYVPDTEVNFVDLIQGEVRENLSQVGDFVIQRSDGVHAYQLAVVVDDGLMGITHVLRGDDLLSSTARQIWLYQVLDLPVPEFAHVPLLYGPDGRRLSKRHGDLSIAALRRRGVKAERIIGFLAGLAGYLPRGEEIKAPDLIDFFTLEKLPRIPLIITDYTDLLGSASNKK